MDNNNKKLALVAIVATAASYVQYKELERVQKRGYKTRSFVMKPKVRATLRELHGHQNILAEMRLQDESRYANYLRMSPDMFDNLLRLVGPQITKSVMGPTMPISPSTKLALTIRYLASGESQMSIAHSYVLAQSTTSQIIAETIQAIWDNLHPRVLPIPKKEDWIEISNGFRCRWDYPNAVGAIDGKHIRIEVISIFNFSFIITMPINYLFIFI